MLSVMLAAAAPVRAGTIEFADVVQQGLAAGRGVRPAADVRLRVMSQAGTLQAGAQSPQTGGGSLQDQAGAATAGQSGTITSTDGTLTQSGGQIETVDLGDVTGTVCDCGEIPIPPVARRGGFPLWPLLGLAAIPLAFIPGGEDTPFNPPSTPLPTPTPTPTNPIPEPTTLLLFGSGLLALGARARRRQGRKAAEEVATVAGEV